MEWGECSISLMKIWIDKLIREYRYGNVLQAVLCTKADPKQIWFQPLWEFLICFAADRIYFNRPGLEPERMMFGTAFAYFGPNESKFIEGFSRFGRVARAVDTPPVRHTMRELWSEVEV
jgi:hypothetical protein